MVVGPAYRFFQPARIQRQHFARGGDRSWQIPGAIDVDHHVLLRADDVADQFQTFHVFLQRDAADLGLEALVALRLEHLYFVLQFGHVLAVAVIGAGDVAGDFAAKAAEQPVQRQPGSLADDVPGGDVDGGSDAHYGFAGPAAFRGDALRGQPENSVMQFFRCQRIFADDVVGDPGLERLDRRFDRRIAGGDANAFEAFVGKHAHQDFIGLGHDEVADPVRAQAFVRRAQDVNFEFGDFHEFLADIGVEAGV